MPIQLVPLPTYASWCNPIEKVWRKLRQELTHLHLWAADLPRLRAEIDYFLDQFAAGSSALLEYVGLGEGGGRDAAERSPHQSPPRLRSLTLDIPD